ncbi:hypothetical protein FHS57_001117 [Runella defluvii]|uniref:DUF7619 domain-containing protein n=1 Tax=Runella defluvii TaxID=370973 RepID=A0A7W5ZGZ8_9BACT|nr:hypothetical protein [Runella defluvii]MBB3837123.1 hypothetical protein [Runella defluvii]
MRFVAKYLFPKAWIFLYLVGLNFEIHAQFNYGTTVLVHGHVPTIYIPSISEFKEYARFISDRLGGNASIYINRVGLLEGEVAFYRNFYWERISGNGSGEQIFIYDWTVDASYEKPGHLESAADRLFGMLIKPVAYNQNHQVINIGHPLERRSHFIAHSRGTLLCLEVFHRLLVHFPKAIEIEHFTALDPHPNAACGDIRSTNSSLPNLPGVEGSLEDCFNLLCSQANNVIIKVPSNVKYAESIYRKNGNYEKAPIINLDGVPVYGHNTRLNDALINHSDVRDWYFGTVNLDWDIDGKATGWYNDILSGPRESVGWYKSRLGGHLNLLKQPSSRNNPRQLEDAIKLRQGKPLSMIFNGSFDHSSVSWGYKESGSQSWKEITISTSNNNKRLLLMNGTLSYTSRFYVPEANRKFLTFKIFKSSNANAKFSNIKLKIQWYGAGSEKTGDEKPAEPCPEKEPNQDSQSYKIPIPDELIGKLASFDIINETSSPETLFFSMDDFDIPFNVPEKNEGSKSQKEDCDDEPEDPPQIPIPNPDQGKAVTPSVIAAFDPNDKLGPVGVNAQRYITGNQPAGYQIRFENYATATAAAQFVKVIDTLDLNLFDPSTFQFGYFNVANSNFYAPPGKKKYLKDQDLRPAKNLILRMEVDFNDTTGILQATYTALDPATMELTEDPVLGFLPPNTKAPEGEGSIFFTVSTYPTLPHGTEVSNKAYIYFDYNPVIPTPPWTNTLDKIEPNSQVQNLPAVSNDTTLVLHWGGSDVGAGTRLYDVYVAVNNNSYKLLVKNTSLTSINFKGKPDSTYKFYSVAVDSVGNEESAPVTFDTQTTIQLTTVGLVQSIQSGDWNKPSTWDCNCVPSATQNVVIKSGHKVALTPAMGPQSCKNLVIEPGAVFDAKGVFLSDPR